MRVARLHLYPLTCCLEDLLRYRSCQKWVPTYRSVLRWDGVVGTDPAAPDREQRGCRCRSVRARSGTEVRALDELETRLGLGTNISPPVPWAPCPGEITRPAVSGCAQARGCSALVCPSLGVGTRQHPAALRWGGSDPRRGTPLPGAISFACRRLCSPCSCYLYSIFSSEAGGQAARVHAAALTPWHTDFCRRWTANPRHPAEGGGPGSRTRRYPSPREHGTLQS